MIPFAILLFIFGVVVATVAICEHRRMARLKKLWRERMHETRSDWELRDRLKAKCEERIGGKSE